MPSKGGSRTMATARAVSAVASVLGPALASAGVVHAQTSAGAARASAIADDLEVAPDALADDPAIESPEWADLYARAVVRRREERERVDREASEAQLLWDEFLRTQGQNVPEGERSLVASDELHEQLRRLAHTAAAAEYERENVIGDPNQTFGIEIEFDGADPNAVARALY